MTSLSKIIRGYFFANIDATAGGSTEFYHKTAVAKCDN